MTGRSIAERLTAAREALARGDLIAAYDLSTDQGEPEDRDLAYVEVRALAGLGDWRNALRRYRAAGIGARGDVDSRALLGRILKDRAFAALPADQPARFAEASEAYAAAIGGAEDFYAPINAASTASRPPLRQRAQRLLTRCVRRPGVRCVSSSPRMEASIPVLSIA